MLLPVQSMRCILLMGRVGLFLMAYKKPKGLCVCIYIYIYLSRRVKNPKHLKSRTCASVLVCLDICVRRNTYTHPTKMCARVCIHRPAPGLARVCVRDSEIAYWVQI